MHRRTSEQMDKRRDTLGDVRGDEDVEDALVELLDGVVSAGSGS